LEITEPVFSLTKNEEIHENHIYLNIQKTQSKDQSNVNELFKLKESQQINSLDKAHTERKEHLTSSVDLEYSHRLSNVEKRRIAYRQQGSLISLPGANGTLPQLISNTPNPTTEELNYLSIPLHKDTKNEELSVNFSVVINSENRKIEQGLKEFEENLVEPNLKNEDQENRLSISQIYSMETKLNLCNKTKICSRQNSDLNDEKNLSQPLSFKKNGIDRNFLEIIKQEEFINKENFKNNKDFDQDVNIDVSSESNCVPLKEINSSIKPATHISKNYFISEENIQTQPKIKTSSINFESPKKHPVEIILDFEQSSSSVSKNPENETFAKQINLMPAIQAAPSVPSQSKLFDKPPIPTPKTNRNEEAKSFLVCHTRPPSVSVNMKMHKKTNGLNFGNNNNNSIYDPLVFTALMESNDESCIGKSIRDVFFAHLFNKKSYAMPSPERLSNIDFSVPELKHDSSSDLKTITQEREMLWAAINKSDAKIKNNTSIINHYQAQIRYVQYMVNKYRAQLEKAKNENLDLQNSLNFVLFDKLSQNPI